MNLPFFIIGPPRSGTTLVAEILSQHSKVHISLETHYFEEVYPILENKSSLPSRKIAEIIINANKKHLSEQQIKSYWDKGNSVTELAEFIEKEANTLTSPLTAYLKYQARRRNKTMYGEKTPRHVFHLDKIKKFYPDSSVIFVVRDGRDFLASYKKKHGPERPNDQPPLYHPVITSLMWRKAIQRILDHQNDCNTYTIKYEQLVTAPEKEIKQLCNFLQLDFKPEMLSPNINNTLYSSSCHKQRQISTGSIGKWQTELSDEEVYIFQQIAGEQEEKLGYTQEKTNIKKTKLLFIYISAPFLLVRALFANKQKIKNLFNYIRQRI
jgi:hypothetical protein